MIPPIDEALMRTPSGAEFAKRVFAKARPGYHPQTAADVEAVIGRHTEASE